MLAEFPVGNSCNQLSLGLGGHFPLEKSATNHTRTVVSNLTQPNEDFHIYYIKTTIMKKIAFIFIVIGILYSCNSDDNSNSNAELIGNWKLIQMTGNIPNSTTTGSEMEWQETYLLKTDGSFKKSRDRNGVITDVSGTYKLIKSSNEIFLELNFNNESEIIGSCYSNLKEEMFFQSENTLSSTWQNCDGPGLKYEKVN